MSATPKVRSGAFPQTPTTIRVGRGAPPTPSPSPPVDDIPKRTSAASRPLFASARPSNASIRSSGARPLATAAPAGSPAGGPLIPLEIVDAPTQRFYAVALYVLLAAWKIYDWVQLLEDNGESFWLFLKWIGLDFVFLFGLPEMRIPWLELSQPVVIFLFLSHVVSDYLLMFNIGVPWHAWFLGLLKVFYDRELSISEHYVKASSILQNSSLISGRQIINILPEGSAILNPSGLPFCIGGLGGSGAGANPNIASLPLYFNATIPAEVELIRLDLDTNEEETLRLTKNQLREISKLVKRQEVGADGVLAAVRYDVPVKKTGAYRLGRVLDEYKLDVQRPSPFSFVVSCPSARVGGAPVSKQSSPWSSSSSSSGPITRCHGDLSDLLLEVEGTPPLKIVYSRTINGKDHSFHFQSLQPEGFASPLLGTVPSRSPGMASSGSGPSSQESLDSDSVVANFPTEGDADISWARSRRVSVGLNETMHLGGEWRYSIDEVHDAFGNVAKYNEPVEDHEVRPRPQKHLVQSFQVRERPRIRLQGCDLRQPLKVARGKSTPFPVRYEIPGVRRPGDGSAHTLTWQFSPIDTLTKSGDHGDVVTTETFYARHADEMPTISTPGLYTLKSVSSGSCEGEVQEPASCLLLNPLEPKLALRSEGIPDSCGGNSIGLRVDLDLVGTPPFLVRYDVSSNGNVRHEKVQVPGMRYQLELIPRVAGNHKYIFRSIDDAVYKSQPLSGAEMTLEQNVKPAARASIDHPTGKANACLQDSVGVDIVLSGEAPFTLEYVLLHEGKRRAFKEENIDKYRHRIDTPAFAQGGEYTLALTSVHDRSGCRTFLQGTGGELKIAVRRQRPRASFGLIENKRRVFVVEDASVRLPLRLTGEGPWRVSYRNLGVEFNEDGTPKRPGQLITRTLNSGNDVLQVNERGSYEIVDISDNQCAGLVDETASSFEVDWFPRPKLSFVQTEAIQEQGNLFVKQDVCEGDVDGFEIDLRGSPPYHVEYDVRHKPAKGSQTSLIHKQLDAALGRASIQMDTSKAGTYRYEFAPPADSLYNNNRHSGKGAASSALVMQQTVYAKPTAAFAKAGQSFKYCMTEQDNEDRIPMVLTGVPPFYVEMEIKHQSGAVSETYRVPSIMTHNYGLQIPRQYLRPGTQQVRIRKIRDARGCQQKTDDVVTVGGGANGNGDSSSALSSGGASTVQVQLFEAPAIYALESRTDYCVGERISYTLSGTPPFDVWYTFGGVARKGASATTTFRRVAEAPGEFTITGISDKASECRAAVNLTRTIHPLPSVRISQGRTARVDIHEGGTVEMKFEFGGTPPFEFTYTRSTNARKGQRSQVLETRHDISYEMSKTVRVSQEGTYEVVAIKDKFCAFSTQRGAEGADSGSGNKRN
ncbi:hypothetical protein SEUCBS139899_008386 [Sporothrix eucalyptigena]|uniref:Nuclear envelope pore membrane protein n=1 Tax=Sporothrix eucalyptigena TaxID=1812306 RepID=A0ABP0CL12_9PEZI